MQLSEMRAALRRRIGNPTTTDTPNVVLDDFLNESMRDIMDRYNFHSSRAMVTFPTVVGVKRYALPTNATALLRVWNATNRQRIMKGDMRLFSETEDQLTTTTGAPRWYTRALDWVQFNPIPDAIYTIGLWYKVNPADLTLDSDVPPIPASWHPGIIRYARYLYYDEIQDVAKAQYALNAFKIWLSDKPSELIEETFDEDSAAEVATLGFRASSSSRLPWDYNE